MDYKIQVVETDEQPVLSIRTRTAVSGLPDKIGASYQTIMEYLGTLGEQPSGMPFVAYYNLDMENLDVEIGFPVATVLAGSGEVETSKIPGGKKATCMHKGTYSEMEETYNAMSAYLINNKIHPTGVVYEYYYNAPDKVPEDELLTEIVFLLND